jgi:predicted dehydrogenase
LRTAAGQQLVPYQESDWNTWYRELAAHLLGGAPVPVSGHDGRRVIAVLETAEKSARSGHSEAVPYD